MKYKLIPEQRWLEFLRQKDWYKYVLPESEKLLKRSNLSTEEREAIKEEVYGFFEEQLEQETVALGTADKNWDEERKPIDTIVIHHTQNPSGITKERLSAMELVRIYAPYYANPDKGDEDIKGQPIYSGHFRDGKQVFYPYHWLVRTDGSLEELLFDNEIGWHAGNWDINRRSIAIAFDNDYEDSRPTDAELATAANLIRTSYNSVLKERIFGHSEVRLKGPTTCPSKLFLSSPTHRGWKEDLLELI